MTLQPLARFHGGGGIVDPKVDNSGDVVLVDSGLGGEMTVTCRRSDVVVSVWG